MCSERHLAEQVLHLGGLARLVRLCKDESARVGSDGVLVACLAAVRKISSACEGGKSKSVSNGDRCQDEARRVFEELDAAELVEPRLLDSFLIFSSKNESFV